MQYIRPHQEELFKMLSKEGLVQHHINDDAQKILWWKINTHSYLDRQLGSFRLYRKYVGGCWQKWYIDLAGIGDIWFHVDIRGIDDFRPGCGKGTPYCEYYDYDYFGYRDKFDKKKGLRRGKLKRIL